MEPRLGEVERHAEVLAAAYNHPHNAPLLGHDEEISADEVLAHYASLAAQGGRGFLLFRDGVLAGDADVRRITAGSAEFAFLIADPAAQGRGLGTAFATMIHAFAFAHLPVDRMYASLVPGNTASRRVFEKLGYQVGASAAARAYADEPDDLVMVIDRAAFVRRHAGAIAELRITRRSGMTGDG